MRDVISGYITLWILIFTFVLSGAWYALAPTISEAENTPQAVIEMEAPVRTGKYVVVYLNQMLLELHDGTTTIATMPLVSQGKPGRYYETIGGEYTNDYKVPLHFSSFGHVYMPYSVHIFGNFFIHGIPYYPNGTKVSSAYSGGCVRLSDADAKRVYDFVQKGTPIIITRGGENDFLPSATSTPIMESIEMTRLMVAMISLEFLAQDTTVADPDGTDTTTRLELLSRLLTGDESVNALYVRQLGAQNYTMYMNKKAQSLGLTNTIFMDTTSAVSTTPEDYARFMEHVTTYKSYLQNVNQATPPASL
jgi:hypothetical protein